MGRTSVLFAMAALAAAFVAASADDASSPLRSSESLPRYATMTPPPKEELPPAPATAPTTKIEVAPSQSAPSPAAATPPRAVRPAVDERAAAALRPVEDASSYRFGPGDKLHVTVFNETDLSGDFAVDGQGFVRLPLVGQVAAAGLTTTVLESRIGEAFVGGGYLLNPRVSVEVVSYRPFYIIGEVAKPGEYAFVNTLSATKAIALAGGFTDRAVQSTIWVRRQGEPKEREMRADDATRIYPGDVVRVERTTYWSIMTLLAPLISPFATTAYILK